MRSAVFTLALFFSLGIAEAQLPSYITGSVSSRGEPLPGITVSLRAKQCDCTTNCRVSCRRCCPASAISVVTDSAGHYEFQDLGTGTFEITAQMDGMSVTSMEVRVGPGGATKNIDLRSPSETITVTSVASPSKSLGTADVRVVDAGTGKALKKTELLLVKRRCDCAQCPSGSSRCSCCPDTVTGFTNEAGRYSAKVPAGTYDVIVAKPKGDVAAGSFTVKSATKTTADIRVKEQP